MNIGGKNTQEEDQIRIWAVPTAGPSRDQHCVGGHPPALTVTPSKGKDPDSSDSEKHLSFLCFNLFYRFFWIFSPFLPHSVVIVDFIGTMKSN